MALILAIVTYGALERGGPLHPFERTLLAALAGPAPGAPDREPAAP